MEEEQEGQSIELLTIKDKDIIKMILGISTAEPTITYAELWSSL